MMGKKCKCCKFSWFSGLFAMAAIMHIIRLIARAEVQINSMVVPMAGSIGIAVVASIISFILCKKSCAACGCSSQK